MTAAAIVRGFWPPPHSDWYRRRFANSLCKRMNNFDASRDALRAEAAAYFLTALEELTDRHAIPQTVRLPRDPRDDFPALYGGAGTTFETPVIVNCCSGETAQLLIDRFISERHGKQGIDWSRDFEMTLADAKTPDGPMIRCVTVRLGDGSSREYYFDKSRPVETLDRLLRRRASEGD